MGHQVKSGLRGTFRGVASEAPTIPLADAIDTLARELMRTECPFGGVSGDFDNCVSTTRESYERKAAERFGLSLDEYYDLKHSEC